MDLLATSTLFQQFLNERRFLRNVTPSTIEWYDTAFKALQRTHGAEPPITRSTVGFVVDLWQQSDELTVGAHAIAGAGSSYRDGNVASGLVYPAAVRAWQFVFPFTWGIAVSLSARLFPGTGPAILYSALACYFAAGAVIVWLRTRLRWFALAGVVATLTCAFAAVHPAVDHWTAIDGLIQVSGVGALILLAFVQSRVEASAWTELRSSMTSGNVRFLDALLFRHVPDLRRPRRTGE
jgi:hypothetical protein